MPSFVLISAYIALMIAPLALSFAQGLPARSLRDDIASGLGLVAFTILLVEFVLSGRFKVISRKIGSDVTMRWHQLLARGALVMVLVHPFLYAAPYDLT
jgi:predicted ferric reductase